MLFPSPRYGAEAITKLIEQVDGNIMLSPSKPFPIIGQVLEKRPMRTFQFPSLDELYRTETKPYPFKKTYAQHKREPFVCLHTSGTTGFPKPILWTHEFPNANIQGFYLPPTEDGIELANVLQGLQNRLMFPFPAFHTSGIFAQCFIGLATGATLLLPPPADSPEAVVDAVADTLDFLGDGDDAITTLGIPPPHMEYLSKNPKLLERISRRVKRIGFGGGDISAEAGNAIAKKMQVFNEYGSTEMGLWPSLNKLYQASDDSGEMWHYTKFHPSVNIRLQTVSTSPEGDVCEAIMVRNEGEYIQPLFTIHPNEKERSIGDLFVRHPQHPELWKHYGRSDDMLNFITTETFHPAPAERRISSHPNVQEVVMVGTMRPKGALIVRLAKSKNVDDIWNIVKEVNKTSPVYARVSKDMILVVDEPFLLTAKGTIQKKATVDRYKRELDELYTKVHGVDMRLDIAMTP
jgi:acyl-coenzyme A synthetase/AMP-(fatty) acid ligase